MKLFLRYVLVLSGMLSLQSVVAQHSELPPKRVEQAPVRSSPRPTSHEVVDSADVMAEPKGGMPTFMKWFASNYEYPMAAIDHGVQGVMKISFIVERDGNLKGFKVVKDLGHDTFQHAVLTLKRGPKWIPAMQDGAPVRMRFELPIHLHAQ